MLFMGFTKATVRMLYDIITFNFFLTINNCFYRNKLIIFGVDSAANTGKPCHLSRFLTLVQI